MSPVDVKHHLLRQLRRMLQRDYLDVYDLLMTEIQIPMNEHSYVLDRIRRWRGPVYGQFDMIFDDGLDNPKMVEASPNE